jgi:ribonuclease P protein component
MSGQSFPREARLLNGVDYKGVFDAAVVKVSNANALILATPTERQQSRLGIVVAKKHIRFAVRRNRFKRLTREYFRSRVLSTPCDLVVLARPQADRIDNMAFIASMDALWTKLERQLAAKQ